MSKARRRERGSILVLALWAVALLAVYSVSIAYGVRQKASLVSRFTSAGRLQAIAWAGVQQARACARTLDASQTYNSLNEIWSNNPPWFKNISVGDGAFTVSYRGEAPAEGPAPVFYGLRDEYSKINLNTADAQTVMRLVETAAGVDRADAEAIGYAVVDWRDSDSGLGHPQLGAETDYYSDLRPPYEAKNLPFEALEELLLVKGINRAIFDKIKDSVTVHGSGAVNINTAPRQVLLALGIGEVLVDRFLAYRRGLDGVDGTGDDGYLMNPGSIAADLMGPLSLNAGESLTLENLASTGKLGTATNLFSVRSRASLGNNGPAMEIEAVLDVTGKVLFVRTSEVQWPS